MGLRIRLLGSVTIEIDGMPVAVASKKARALLGYLALREGAEVSRGVLTDLLWGERSESQARGSLRQTLSELRAALAGSTSQSIMANKETVAWAAGSAWIDAKLVETAAGSADHEALRCAAELIGGELMEGLSLGEAGFEQWLAAERERFRLLAGRIHARLMEHAERDGRLEEALTHGLKLLSFDPLQEHVHRALMRLYAAQGRHDAALAQYERCRRELSNQLGVRPAAETEDLARSIRAARREGPAKPRSLPSPRTEPERPVTASVKRRIAAIMVGDVVGYSATRERAEERTAQRLEALISDKIVLLDGRIFNTAGDATLAEFPTAIAAVRCAVEIRSALAGEQDQDSPPLRMRFGIHLADVVVRGDDLVGDGVNLAARIQQAADPDSIDVSGSLFEHIRRNSPFIFDPLGERNLKNILEPILVYRLRGEMGAHRLQVAPTRRKATRERRPSSIAILPFRVGGEDQAQRFLAEGLTDELIVELGRFRRMFVSSRTASFAVGETQQDPVQVGDALSVRYVLAGHVRKLGDRVRISLTLSETEAGSVVWSDKISRPFDDLLDLLDETVSKIAATVFGRVEDASMVAVRRRRPQNMTAFECLLRGIAHHRLGGVSDDNVQEAIKWFDKAISADPNYAAAYAWRVCAAGWLPNLDFDRAEHDIRRALELDPCDPEAHRIMGSIELLKQNFAVAEAHSLKAIELNPSDANIKARVASIHTFVGDAERALALLDQAEALDPLLPVWCIEERGVALYALERYADALEALAKLSFQTYRSRLYRAAALTALERQQEAKKLVKEALANNPRLTISRFMFNERYRDLAKKRELQRRLEQAGLPGY